MIQKNKPQGKPEKVSEKILTKAGPKAASAPKKAVVAVAPKVESVAKVSKQIAEKRIAIIRVRGSVHLRSGIADAMKMLNLNRVNHCVVVDNRPQYMGMINKAKDYITFGEINEETVASLIAKRGRLPGNVRLDDAYVKNATGKDIAGFAGAFMKFEKELKDIPDISPVFRLRPPKKGHARGGIKKPCSVGGALGNRKEKINDLLAKMI